MPTAIERLHTEIDTISFGENPSLFVAVRSVSNEMHGANAWFTPTVGLQSLIIFCAASRRHSEYVDSWIGSGQQAPVSGGMREDGQKKSQPVHGLEFNGTIVHVTDPEQSKAHLATFLANGTFQEAEIEDYLHPSKSASEVPSHAVYEIFPSEWTVFDGRLGSSNPERLVRIQWPPTEAE